MNIITESKNIEHIKLNECSICFDLLTKENTHINKCNHIFCIECIRKHITLSINNNILNISCPNVKCKYIYSFIDIYQIVTCDIFEKYKRFIMKNDKRFRKKNNKNKMVACPNCESGVMYNNKKNVRCYECDYKFCFKCQVKHKKITCKKYKKWKKKNDNRNKLFGKFIKKKIYKHCPDCKIIISKKDGCDNMICRYCGKDFRWDKAKKVKKTANLDT